jgi:hypothetical protein
MAAARQATEPTDPAAFPAGAVTVASASVAATAARWASLSAVAFDASCRKPITASLASTPTSGGLLGLALVFLVTDMTSPGGESFYVTL